MNPATPISQPPASLAEAGKVTQRYTIFKRQQQLFGLTIDLVREVVPGQPLTRVARAQEQIMGVFSLRGEILPVVVIDGWLGLPVSEDNYLQPVIVLRRGDLLAGLRVDAIQRVVNVPTDELQPHPTDTGESLLKSIWNRPGQPPITLLNDVTLVEMLCQQAAVNA